MSACVDLGLASCAGVGQSAPSTAQMQHEDDTLAAEVRPMMENDAGATKLTLDAPTRSTAATAVPASASALRSIAEEDGFPCACPVAQQWVTEQRRHIHRQAAKIAEWKKSMEDFKRWHSRTLQSATAKLKAETAAMQTRVQQLEASEQTLLQRVQQLQQQVQQASIETTLPLEDEEGEDDELELEEDEQEPLSASSSSCSSTSSVASAPSSPFPSSRSPRTPRPSHRRRASSDESTFSTPIVSPRGVQQQQHEQPSEALAVVVVSAPTGVTQTQSLVTLPQAQDMQLAVAFPRALTVADKATVDDHVNNLFAQVGALKSQLMARRRALAEAAAVEAQQQQQQQLQLQEPQLMHVSTSVIDGPQPMRQQSHSRTLSQASIGNNADGQPELSINTTTKTHVRTASLAAAPFTVEDVTAAASSAEPADDLDITNAPSDEASVTHHVTTLAQRSGNLADFVTAVSAHVGQYHEAIHTLRAQVAHLQTQAQRTQEDKEHLEAKVQQQAQRADSEAEEMHKQLSHKDVQLHQLQASIDSVQKHVEEMQRDFALPSPAAAASAAAVKSKDAVAPTAAADSAASAATPTTAASAAAVLHFLVVLRAYVHELCRAQRSAQDELTASREANTRLGRKLLQQQHQHQTESSHSSNNTNEQEQNERIRLLQERINMLELMLLQSAQAHARDASTTSSSPAPAASAAAVAAVAPPTCTVLPSQAREGPRAVVIPHLPLQSVLSAERSQGILALAMLRAENEEKQNHHARSFGTAPVSHSGATFTRAARLPLGGQLASPPPPVHYDAATDAAAGPVASSPSSTPSRSNNSTARSNSSSGSNSNPATQWGAAVARAAGVSTAECTKAKGFGVQGPVKEFVASSFKQQQPQPQLQKGAAFQLLARTPFASAAASPASKPVVAAAPTAARLSGFSF